MDDVVDEPRVAPQRCAPPRGREIRLGGDRVLPVRQLVGNVREQLDECDSHVCRSALRPAGREEAEPVEHQRTERVVVLGEVVDRRRLGELRRADADSLAVEVRRTLDLERELDRCKLGVEPGRRLFAERADITDTAALQDVMGRHSPKAVLHLAFDPSGFERQTEVIE